MPSSYIVPARFLASTIILAYAWLAYKRLRRRGVSATELVILVHCALTLVPILMEYFGGQASLAVFPALRNILLDETVELIYLIYAVCVPPILWLFQFKAVRPARRPSRIPGSEVASAIRLYRPIIWAAVFLPVCYVWLAPHPELFMTYAAAATRAFDADDVLFFAELYPLTYLALLSAALLFFTSRRPLMAGPALFVAVLAVGWLNGKRNYVFLMLLLSIAVLALRQRWMLRRVVIVGGLTVLGYSFFSQWYQATYRGTFLTDTGLYDALRLDIGRDTDIRLAIASEVHPTLPPILEYRCQGLLFNALFFIPRQYWEEKPRPYYHYATLRALGGGYVPLLSWGLTTSWLGETIANCGWLGMLVGPITLALFCRVGDRCRDPIMSLLTALNGALLLEVHMSAFLPLLIIWLVLILTHRWQRRSAGAPLPGLAYTT